MLSCNAKRTKVLWYSVPQCALISAHCLAFQHFLGRKLPGGSAGKNPPAMQETQETRFNPLETGMAMHSSILAWENPWTKDPGRLQFMGLQRTGHDLATDFLFRRERYTHAGTWWQSYHFESTYNWISQHLYLLVVLSCCRFPNFFKFLYVSFHVYYFYFYTFRLYFIPPCSLPVLVVLFWEINQYLLQPPSLPTFSSKCKAKSKVSFSWDFVLLAPLLSSGDHYFPEESSLPDTY